MSQQLSDWVQAMPAWRDEWEKGVAEPPLNLTHLEVPAVRNILAELGVSWTPDNQWILCYLCEICLESLLIDEVMQYLIKEKEIDVEETRAWIEREAAIWREWAQQLPKAEQEALETLTLQSQTDKQKLQLEAAEMAIAMARLFTRLELLCSEVKELRQELETIETALVEVTTEIHDTRAEMRAERTSAAEEIALLEALEVKIAEGRSAQVEGMFSVAWGNLFAEHAEIRQHNDKDRIEYYFRQAAQSLADEQFSHNPWQGQTETQDIPEELDEAIEVEPSAPPEEEESVDNGLLDGIFASNPRPLTPGLEAQRATGATHLESALHLALGQAYHISAVHSHWRVMRESYFSSQVGIDRHMQRMSDVVTRLVERKRHYESTLVPKLEALEARRVDLLERKATVLAQLHEKDGLISEGLKEAEQLERQVRHIDALINRVPTYEETMQADTQQGETPPRPPPMYTELPSLDTIREALAEPSTIQADQGISVEEESEEESFEDEDLSFLSAEDLVKLDKKNQALFDSGLSMQRQIRVDGK